MVLRNRRPHSPGWGERPVHRTQAGRAGCRAGHSARRAACADLSADKLADYLTGELRGQLERRVEKLRELASFTTRSLEDERRYVEASLGLQVFSHRLFEHMRSGSGH